ncbi:cobalamin-binding protein [Paenibacillus albiflavus]|uniref:Cobalamin-binding protein n=1 Tax=Paenibacillus albiflavus TaxID=2545760 RepID=A0A4R4E4J8_9BACL|nr:helical backbone metal receptor [Paenibacillus albiflavus]TCZ73773.1 cobalamin-binding protein [Paenibacillus albiflavus]
MKTDLRKNKLFMSLLTASLLVVMTACGAKTADPAATATPTPAAATTPAPEAKADAHTQYPLTVKDATGQEFKFDKAPERIVSVSPAETESLFALGLGDKIVGVSDYDDYPEEAKSKPKMGSITKPTVEALIGAKPDIVFTGVSMKEATVEELRKVGIQIFKVEPKTLDDVMNNIVLYGQITDANEAAQKIVTKMKQEIELVQSAVKDVKPEDRKKVLLEFSPGWTVGKGEFMSELITIAGGVNVAAELGITGWAEMNEELIIQQNPQVILYADKLVDDKSKKTLETLIRERASWSKVDAIVKNQLFGLDVNSLSRPGPRVTEGLLQVAKALYPDLVK